MYDKPPILKGYWWQCEECQSTFLFNKITNSNSIAAFIWDELIPGKWDQILLTKQCPECKGYGLKITYLFPRKDRLTITTRHIVGLDPNNEGYVPMVWETYSHSSKNEPWVDFKYVIKRNAYGLNKPPVFTKQSFKALAERFYDLTGTYFY